MDEINEYLEREDFLKFVKDTVENKRGTLDYMLKSGDPLARVIAQRIFINYEQEREKWTQIITRNIK